MDKFKVAIDIFIRVVFIIHIIKALLVKDQNKRIDSVISAIIVLSLIK